ncbi:kinetochore protein CHL4 like-domain-containing protein [Apiosordaria backusii]|uniref:Kinetochore protein CHL4 like-domain-containing protein n=1 Tax=Apiosordaria backusii TaxID=314023 RepID=A0AA40K616_9PEZI|nr:kinetochore protein CHL4 like-domain-containing protein [Apiosordaria backusii]
MGLSLTTTFLSSSLRVYSSNPATTNILTRLSYTSLISVALDLLDESNLPHAQPYLLGDADDDDDTDHFYPAARSIEPLRAIHSSLQARKGSKREVLNPELVEHQGVGRTNYTGGGWTVYTGEKKREAPLDLVLPSPRLPPDSGKGGVRDGQGVKGAVKRAAVGMSEAERREERAVKGARLVAQARFGGTAMVGDGKGEEDRGLEGWQPHVRLTFHGSHVFAGIRQLVECGIIDGERMPGWMTREEGVTIGSVWSGRIRGHKGSGL